MEILEEKISNWHNSPDRTTPLWSRGSPTIVRYGETLYATVMEPVFNAIEPNNLILNVYRRDKNSSWTLMYRDENNLQREPCPVMLSPKGELIITSNPTYLEKCTTGKPAYHSASIPLIYVFDLNQDFPGHPRIIIPKWNKEYPFNAHSYRAGTIDSSTGDYFLMNLYNNCNEKQAWSLLDNMHHTIRTGKIRYPLRSCYQSMALRDNAVHILSVSDIVEPVQEWKDYKYQVTGRSWDYDFRTIYYAYSDDIRSSDFLEPIVIDSSEETCGKAFGLDIFVDEAGRAHLLYTMRNIWHSFMRDKFFPDLPLLSAIKYCIVEKGSVIFRRTIDETSILKDEQDSSDYTGFFYETESGAPGVVFRRCNSGDEERANGWYLANNIHDESMSVQLLPGVEITDGFNGKRRNGSDLSGSIDIYGITKDEIRYVRITP